MLPTLFPDPVRLDADRNHAGSPALPTRMDVERSRLEHQRMSYVASDPELHVRYVIDHQRRAAELAALLREARGDRPGFLAQVRLGIGAMLINLGQRLAPPVHRSRPLTAYDVRRARTGVS